MRENKKKSGKCFVDCDCFSCGCICGYFCWICLVK